MLFVLRQIALVAVLLLPSIGLPAHAMTKAALDAELAPYVTDAAQRDFLATEAAAAGVSEFHFIGSAALQAECPGGEYGCSTFNSGSRRGDVYLNVEVAGGTGVTNITHEVSHIAAFRKGCDVHGDVWLEYLMGMAQRYEAQFPGKKWGKSAPTASVQAKYARYAGERGSCRTANTPDLHMKVSRVVLNVPKAMTDQLAGAVEVSIVSVDHAKSTMRDVLKRKMTVIAPGVFALDLNTKSLKRAVQKGNLLCVNVNPPYYVFNGADGGEPSGLCYQTGGTLSEGPYFWMYPLSADGVLTFKYADIRHL